jgi:uncharacterized coiled-coil DUF342 family protein
MNELVNAFFSMQGLGNTIQSLIAAGFVYLLFQKALSKQMGGLKKQIDDLKKQIGELEKQFIRLDAKIDALRAELKGDIKDLRREMDNMRKALLLVANQTLDDPERIERIKDLLTI